MKVLLVPQYSHNKKIDYKFEGDVITATIDSVTDTFDFSSMPDGVAEYIETILPINPIISAKRENGMLWIELLNFIDKESTEKERFPDWQVIE